MISQGVNALDVLVLCGGKGTRLQSTVSDRPKSMAPLRGRPFLEWQLLALRKSGFKNIVLCTGYLKESIRDYFGDGGKLGLCLRYSEEHVVRGTGGAIRNASSLVQTDPVVVINGDSWCDVSIAQMVDLHHERKAMGTIALTTVPYTERYGQVVLDHNQEVIRFTEKSKTEATGWINAGMYVLAHSLIESIPEQSCISLEHDVFPNWVKKGLYGYSGKRHFFDIGTPSSYAQAEHDFEQVFHLAALQNLSMRQTA